MEVAIVHTIEEAQQAVVDGKLPAVDVTDGSFEFLMGELKAAGIRQATFHECVEAALLAGKNIPKGHYVRGKGWEA